jgi:hypothetical protein
MIIKEGEKITIKDFITTIIKEPTVIITKDEIHAVNPNHIVHVWYDKSLSTIYIQLPTATIAIKVNGNKVIESAYVEH